MPKLGTFVDGGVPVAADLNAGAAAWGTWSPTYTNLTVGNGSVTAKYGYYGRVPFAKWSFTMGTTSAIGSAPTVSLPVNFSNSIETGICRYTDTGTANYPGSVLPATSSTVGLYAWLASGTYVSATALSSTIPFTWGSTDVLTFTIFYEATS